MNSQIIPQMEKSDLKALFYLMNGKPESRVKVYTAPIQIEKDDIKNLNIRIANKLRTHSIEAVITTVRIGYEDALYDEFGTWEDFDKKPDNTTTECIDEVVIKWDFMVNLDEYKTPQKHALLVRISTDFKTSNLLQLLTTSHQEDIEDIDINLAPGFCRVDFINAQISKELINEVTDWYKSCKSPKLIPDFMYACKKVRSKIALIIDQLFMLTSLLMLLGIGLWAKRTFFPDGNLIPIEYSAVYTVVSIYILLVPTRRIGMHLGQVTYNILSAIEGCRVVFNVTAGDKKAAAEQYDENKKRGHKFVANFCLNMAYNLIASYIFFWLTRN